MSYASYILGSPRAYGMWFSVQQLPCWIYHPRPLHAILFTLLSRYATRDTWIELEIFSLTSSSSYFELNFAFTSGSWSAASPPFACAQLPPSPFAQDTFAKEPEPHSLLSKPLPLLPPRTPSPFSFTHRPAQSASLAFPHHHPHHLRSPTSLDDLRSVTASPPPMHLPSPAVSQAQLAFLFGSPPKPAESVHFFPAPAAPHGGKGKEEAKGRPRRGTLRISTATNATSTTQGTGGSSGTWFRRIRAGFSPGS
ncbi:hypothetical protein C8Q74DRAFT_1364076 [Fomes fomentarius]|nr:hypothetical protein C8Q74DRAFT_1364076 [Fomes fomentarius]